MTMTLPPPERATLFSPDRAYRYTLWREWGKSLVPMCNDDSYLCVIGLNPSTADETQDDPTIRRCVDYAKRWGFGALCMLNLFAYRATNPKDMLHRMMPTGPENDAHIVRCTKGAGLVLAAWGAQGSHMRRDEQVRKLCPILWCLGTTKDGHPRHPLYVRAAVHPQPYGEAARQLQDSAILACNPRTMHKQPLEQAMQAWGRRT